MHKNIIYFCISILYPERLGLPGGLALNPPVMQETQVWSLGQEDPVEEGMATHSEEAGGL